MKSNKKKMSKIILAATAASYVAFGPLGTAFASDAQFDVKTNWTHEQMQAGAAYQADLNREGPDSLKGSTLAPPEQVRWTHEQMQEGAAKQAALSQEGPDSLNKWTPHNGTATASNSILSDGVAWTSEEMRLGAERQEALGREG